MLRNDNLERKHRSRKGLELNEKNAEAILFNYIQNNGLCANERKLYTPNKIWVNPDLVILVRQRLKRRNYRKNFLDHYLYLCSTIFFLQCVDKRYEDMEYVPINYKIMSSIISRDKYKRIVDDLIKWKVIQVNGSYEAGKKSKGYKLLAPYYSAVKQRPIKDTTINKKLNNRKRAEMEQINKMPLPYQYLAMTNTLIKVDYWSAVSYNCDVYHTNKPKVFDSNQYSISSYQAGDYRFTVDNFSYRIHTNLTNFKSDLRPFLTVDGVPLGQVDIRNSQPLFFYLYIKDVKGIPEYEINDYKHLVESGLFYEFFMEGLNIPLTKRSNTKAKILTALFFDRNRNNESRYMKIFRERFPSVASHILEIKSENYKILAQKLQRAESHFIIEKVASEFINTNVSKGEFKFISTIHDSVVVKVTDLEDVRRIMTKILKMRALQLRFWLQNFATMKPEEDYKRYIGK